MPPSRAQARRPRHASAGSSSSGWVAPWRPPSLPRALAGTEVTGPSYALTTDGRKRFNLCDPDLPPALDRRSDPDEGDRGDDQQREPDADCATRRGPLDQAAEQVARDDPDEGCRDRHRHHRERHEGTPQGDRHLRGAERRNGPDRDDPDLRVDQLERCRLEESHRARGGRPLERPRTGDLPGEIEKVDRAADLHRERESRDRRDEDAEAGRHQDRQQPDAEGRAQDVRARPPQPERGPRGPEEDVVRAGRDGADEPETEQRDEPVHAGTVDGRSPGVLYDPAVMPEAGEPLDTVRAWKPPVPGVREVLHARHIEHAYPIHTHDVWTVLLVDQGAIRYDLDQRNHGAESSMVSILPPHVVHDGRPATADGYRKRVIYVEPSVIAETLIGSAVDRPA